MDQPENPNFALERPSPPQESAPEAQPTAPEASPETPAPAPERSGAERAANYEQQRPSQGVVLPPVQLPQTPVATQPAVTPDAAGPSVADDVDVIEMEWVKRAEEIIESTRDDPHAQERAVEALQSDYLEKRYGKKVKRSRSE